jgi:hypothetical protein
MNEMKPIPSGQRPRWYRSLYFRIGFSFVVFVPSMPGSITSEDNQIERARSDHVDSGAAIRDLRHSEAGEPEVQPHELADRRLVFDHQDLRSWRRGSRGRHAR